MKKVIFPFLFLFLLSGCSSQPLTKTDFILGTVVQVTIYQGGNEEILNHCMEMCRAYENQLSPTIEGSEIYQINHAGGRSVTVSEETAFLIEKGLEYGALSEGKFDISIQPVSSLWIFGSENPALPDPAQVQEALKAVEYRDVLVEGNAVTLTRPGAALDLGGIAKGYIADQLGAYLREEGVTSAIINLGGNVLCVGEKEPGIPFSIGVRNPFDEQNGIIGRLSVRDKSVVTSGVYERYFTIDGVRYHHLLDTKTGYPIENGLSSVTVVTDQSIDGDALSTILFAMGKEQGLAYAQSLDGVEAIFVDSTGEVSATSGIGTSIPFSQ